MTPLLFSTFEVTAQAFYRASLSFAIVNLKPIVPGRKDFTKRFKIISMNRANSLFLIQMFSFFQIELFRVSLILMVLSEIPCHDIILLVET
jgi:hypothetical protein